ncbi:MAG: hypothetical protein IPM16_02705 [Chloroflexi bacterium]|nr:hypothetical protein [Chloroflexota bacterium]
MRNRADNVRSWTIEELILILMRQFKRLLAERGADLNDAQMRDLAQAVADNRGGSTDDTLSTIRNALNRVTAESEALLAGWGLTYTESLKTSMEDMPGWDTTADFLSLANEKVNAELRISAGSALRLLLGESEALRNVLTTATHGAGDPEDVDAVIALRAMAHFFGADATDSKGVLEASEAWLTANGR